jgi:hypothetical protein
MLGIDLGRGPAGNKPLLRDDILAYFRERREDESYAP